MHDDEEQPPYRSLAPGLNDHEDFSAADAQALREYIAKVVAKPTWTARAVAVDGCVDDLLDDDGILDADLLDLMDDETSRNRPPNHFCALCGDGGWPAGMACRRLLAAQAAGEETPYDPRTGNKKRHPHAEGG